MPLLFSILSFFLPTQLALHIYSQQTSVYGFQIDYLLPTIYLTDLIIILIIALSFGKIRFDKKYLKYVIFYILFLIINISHSIYYLPAIYKWLKVTELLLLAVIILQNKNIDFFKNFLKPLSYSMLLVSLLGILQFINQGSIGGLFYWLGERSLRFSDANVSPYPYSTFSHPNSFAGFLLVFTILILQFKNKFNQKYFYFLFLLLLINLILTNSLNVFLAVFVLILIKLPKSFNFSYLFFSFGERFITHRLELIKASIQMIRENLLTGVGLNNFVPNLPRVSNTFLNAWELQPVHNIFLLVFSETGVIGLYALCYMFYGVLTAYNLPLMAILMTGLSDHYWLTLQQNMLLLTYVLAFNYKWKTKK